MLYYVVWKIPGMQIKGYNCLIWDWYCRLKILHLLQVIYLALERSQFVN